MICIIKKYIFVLFILVTNYCFAQTESLSEQDREEFQVRVGQMVDILQLRLNRIADKEVSYEVRKQYIEQTLKMFIGEGKAYTDLDGNEYPAVTMNIPSRQNKTSRKIPLKVYLNNLMNLTYKIIEIGQIE